MFKVTEFFCKKKKVPQKFWIRVRHAIFPLAIGQKLPLGFGPFAEHCRKVQCLSPEVHLPHCVSWSFLGDLGGSTNLRFVAGSVRSGDGSSNQQLDFLLLGLFSFWFSWTYGFFAQYSQGPSFCEYVACLITILLEQTSVQEVDTQKFQNIINQLFFSLAFLDSICCVGSQLLMLH